MKFKLGDIVLINHVDGWSDDPLYLSAIGKTGTITKIRVGSYYIDNNKYRINFSDNMLELAKINNWKKHMED